MPIGYIKSINSEFIKKINYIVKLTSTFRLYYYIPIIFTFFKY